MSTALTTSLCAKRPSPESPMANPKPTEKLFPQDIRTNLISLRRDLHRHPELSFQEERTAQRLFNELEALKPTGLKKVGTGVVARIKGQIPGAPAVAIRGDIDALPINEDTGLPYASETEGVMHACGHDVHATWAIGAAILLSRHPASGDVVIVLQPAEEVGQGAAAILSSGELQDVAAIFGGHVDRRFEVGHVVAQEGPLAASSDAFEIEITGKGAHGARPHEASDPVVAAAATIMALQTLVSRKLDPSSPGVVTVGSIHAGRAGNIIPDRATLTGTIRATTPETRALLRRGVQSIAESQAATLGLEASFRRLAGTPPIVNPPLPVAWARKATENVLGKQALQPLGYVNMGGEDFSIYMEKMAGCFLRIGAREPGGDVIPAHSPAFYAAEESIFVGAAVLAETARVASAALLETRRSS